MLISPHALSAKNHRDLRFTPKANYAFAQPITSCPLSAEEIAEAAKFYPVVFTSGKQVQPIVLLGLHGVNEFVNAEGQWRTGVYIPAYFRAYPFGFAKTATAGQFAVVIDMAAPQFSTKEGEPLFADGDALSPTLTRARDYLFQMQASAERTTALCAPLNEAKVLSLVGIQQGEAEPLRLPRLRVANQKRIAALPDVVILAWARNGLLGLLTLQMASMSNLDRLKQM